MFCLLWVWISHKPWPSGRYGSSDAESCIDHGRMLLLPLLLLLHRIVHARHEHQLRSVQGFVVVQWTT